MTREQMNRAARVALAGVLALSCLGMFGCKTSDVLTELLVDQDSDDTDDDNDDSFLNNLLTSLIDTEELPQLQEEEEADIERERVEEDAVEGDEDSDEAVAQSTYSETAAEQAAATSESATSGESSGSTTTSSGATSTDATGDAEDESGDEGAGTESGDSDEAGSDGEGDEVLVLRGSGGDGKVYGADSTYTELPEDIQTAVAFGEYANMVVSFAGKYALAGADDDYLSNSFIQSAFGDEVATTETIDVDDDEGTIDVDAVVELAPDALFIGNDTYELTDSEEEQLADAMITVVYLPSLASDSDIVSTASYIGEMFGGSEDTLSGEDAEAAAEEYVAWHDEVLEQVIEDNGGLSGEMNYDTGDEDDESLTDISHWTIYIDDWDDATYSAYPDGVFSWTDSTGVAIAKVGYKWSPLCYYLSAGGTNNNGATFKASVYYGQASHLYYVWQFNLGRVSSTSNWSGTSKSVSKLSSSGTSDLLVKSSDESTTLGSDDFSYVVVRNQEIQAKLEKSQAQSNGLYTVYGTVTSSDGTTARGFLSGTGSLCASYISGSFDVEVNPTGLYSSWVDGSCESVLEAAWAYDLNNGTSSLDGLIKEYYSLFYDYSISSSEIKAIYAGEES